MSRRAALAAIGVGLALGISAEHVLVRRWLTNVVSGDKVLGSLHSTSVEVVANDGVELHVEVDEPQDPTDNLTVIFCHGYALNQNSWHFQRRDLHGQARLVFADQRSHGRSGRGAADHATIDQLGLDLGAIVDQVAGAGPVILVGHSMGGMTIMGLALARPELFGAPGPVRGVALLGTSAGGLSTRPFGLPPFVGRLLHKYSARVVGAAIKNGRIINFGRQYENDLGLYLTWRYSFGSRVPADLVNFTAEMINATPIEVLAEFLPGLESHEKSQALAALGTIPVTIMVGGSDRLTPPSHSFEMLSRLPNAELEVLPRTGHMLMLEREAEVTAALLELIIRVRNDAHS